MNGCYCNCGGCSRGGYTVVLMIVGALLAFALGLVFGAAFAETFTPLLPVLIAAVIGLAVLFTVFLILRLYARRRN